MVNNQYDTTRAAIESAPPVTVTGLHFLGIDLNDWVALLTILYVLLQLVFMLRRELARQPVPVIVQACEEDTHGPE